MKEQEPTNCTRCEADVIGTHYHDGTMAMSSVVNRKGLFGDDWEFIVLCVDCYMEYHEAMYTWMRGGQIRVRI